MEKLVKMIAKQEDKMHPVERVARVHYEITRIHPFDDCNGWVSRLF